MKKSAAPLVALSLAISALPGCVRSVNPIGSQEDAIFDTNLVGIWGSDDAHDLYEVTTEDQGSYAMVHTDEDCHQGAFTMHLTEVGGHRFLNIYPEEPDAYENELYTTLLIGAFLIVRVEVTGSNVETWVIDPDWLEEHVESHPKSATLASLDEALLTGPTQQIRALYLEYFKAPGVLDEPGQLIRLSPKRVEELRSRCASKTAASSG